MGIEHTPEWQQMMSMRSACNRVIREVFDVDNEQIVRFENTETPHILDKEFCIDVEVELHNGSRILGQEKTLSNKFYRYKTFTMEYYQNRYTKEKGEFFKIASQFYLHGYSDNCGDEFIE